MEFYVTITAMTAKFTQAGFSEIIKVFTYYDFLWSILCCIL